MTAVTALPLTQKALKVAGSSAFELVSDAPLPKLDEDDSVLIRVVCVAINPDDGKSADMSPTPGATSGLDFAGVVVAIRADANLDSNGSEVPLKIGDRVMGFVFGNNPNPQAHDNGAFAEYVTVSRRLLWRVPDHMSLETAASLPVGIASAGMALQYLQIPMTALQAAISRSVAPTTSDELEDALGIDVDVHVLVYGAGTCAGALAIQLFKAAGFTPIACCSSESAGRAKQLGATATFDYQSATCGRDIRDYTNDALELAIDCISESSSMSICYEAIGTAGGRYVSLDPFSARGCVRRSVRPDWICSFTQFGRPIRWAPPYNLDERPSDCRFAQEWYHLTQLLLDADLLKAPTLETRSGGLSALPEGINEVRMGLVKRRKLVYRITEDVAILG